MEKFNEKITNFIALNKRAVTSVVVVAAIIFAIFFAKYFALLVFGGIALCSLYEFTQMVSAKIDINSKFILASGVIMLLASQLTWLNSQLSIVILLSIISSTVFVATTKQIFIREKTGKSNAIEVVGAYILGLVFITCPWCTALIFLNGYKFPTVAKQLLLAVFLSTWACDTFAYLIGCAIGRHKLAPMTSEKKSIEGLVAGCIGSVVAAMLYAFLLSVMGIRACNPIYIFVIGVICGTIGQLGDLAESLIKREIGVKDSGNLLPGHGGFLDRFDSILFNMTFFFLLFAVVNIF